MPETQQNSAAPAGFGDNKGIRFHIKTGGKSYNCTLQDRAAYERMKVSPTGSTDSVESSSSSSDSAQKST